MFHIVETRKPFEQAASDLEAAVLRNGFGVLNVHDFRKTLQSRGFVFHEECRVFEVCNPGQALKVLSADMRLNMALPCRISVYTDKGRTWIGLIKPAALLSMLSGDPALESLAREVEEKTVRMIEEAR